MKRSLLLCAAIPLAFLCSCEMGDSDSYMKTRSEAVQVDTGSISRINVSQCVGKCTLRYGDVENVKLMSDSTFSGISEKKVSSAYENTRLKYELRDDELYVCFVDDSTGDELGSISNHTSKYVNVTTDIEVILPMSFNDFAVSSNVGDITANGLSGSFNIFTDVGDIEMKNVSVMGDSSVEAEVGNVELSFGDVGECNFKVEADVGNIALDTSGLKYEELSRSDKLVAMEIELLIDNKCTLDLQADVGNIDINE